MKITIRPMEKSDWPAVAEIYRQGISTGSATFQTDIPEYAQWDSAHLDICRMIAESAGETAGWAALSPVSGRCVYRGVAEVSIYVAERFRGGGVGMSLLGEMISRSESEGIWMLQSAIIEENAASLALHEKCGFRRVGFREKIARDTRGRWRNTVLMEKRSRVVGVD